MKKEIYFNRPKAFAQIGLGFFCWAVFPLGGIFYDTWLMKMIHESILFITNDYGTYFFLFGLFFIIGGSCIYFGSKGISSKPQIILDQETLFIGLKVNKTFKWKNVLNARIKTESVDYRRVEFLELTVLASIQGKRHKRTIDAPAHLLEMNPYDVADLINIEIQSYRDS